MFSAIKLIIFVIEKKATTSESFQFLLLSYIRRNKSSKKGEEGDKKQSFCSCRVEN